MNSIQASNNPQFNGMQGQDRKNGQLNLVKIYLRRPNKFTSIIRVNNFVNSKQLLDLACKKLGICSQNIVLFVKGCKIQESDCFKQSIYYLSDNDIVHVHDLSRIINTNIKIILKPFQCSLEKQVSIFFQTQSSNKIGESIRKYMKIHHDFAFIQSGRKLDLQKSFQEEFVQNDSTITITSFKEQTTQEENVKQEQILSNKNSQVPQQQEQKPTKMKTILRKSVSWSTNENYNQMSFKKKQKPSIYKSQSISQGKQTIWQSDGSGDLNKNLRKKILAKKHKEISNQIHEESRQENSAEMDHHIEYSDQEDISDIRPRQTTLFTSKQRQELQNEMKKLLFSDLFQDKFEQQKKPQIKNLQPPKIPTYDFLQQTDEMEMKQSDSDEDENYKQIKHQKSSSSDSDDEQQAQNSKKKSNTLSKSKQLLFQTPINLRESIGKSRGAYVVPMIPTRDFDVRQNEDDN